MKVAVWDTYVTRKDGKTMHFDIIVPEEQKNEEIIYNYGKNFLKNRNQEGQVLSSKECNFCHVEGIKPEWEDSIKQHGHFIFEMENCN